MNKIKLWFKKKIGITSRDEKIALLESNLQEANKEIKFLNNNLQEANKFVPKVYIRTELEKEIISITVSMTRFSLFENFDLSMECLEKKIIYEMSEYRNKNFKD